MYTLMYACMDGTFCDVNSAQEQDQESLHNEICRAHVVCVVYDLTAEDALDRVSPWEEVGGQEKQFATDIR